LPLIGLITVIKTQLRRHLPICPTFVSLLALHGIREGFQDAANSSVNPHVPELINAVSDAKQSESLSKLKLVLAKWSSLPSVIQQTIHLLAEQASKAD
jgi:hypothetical protein